MGTIKEFWKTAILLLAAFLLFLFRDSVGQLPHWICPIAALAYIAFSTSKHIGNLEKRIAWLEENKRTESDRI